MTRARTSAPSKATKQLEALRRKLGREKFDEAAALGSRMLVSGADPTEIEAALKQTLRGTTVEASAGILIECLPHTS